MVVPARAATGINQTLNFQGRLLNSAGAVVPDGTYNLQFKIYQDGDGVLGGGDETLKWTESWVYGTGSPDNRVVVRNGYFSVRLGSITAFGSSVDWNQDTLWLSMNVGNTSTAASFAVASGDGEMSPFRRLSSSVYALNAGQLGGLTSGQFVQYATGTVQTDSTTNASVYLNKTGVSGNLITLQKGGVDAFSVDNDGDLLFGSNANKTVSVTQSAAGTAGRSLTMTAGQGGTGTGSAGGNLVLQGGAGGGTNANGGNVTVDAGAKTGTGTNGTISIGATNASAIAIGNSTNTTAIGGALTVAQTITATGNLTAGTIIGSGTFQTANGATSTGTTYRSGNTTAGASGSVEIRSGNAVGGNSGGVTIDTGTSSGGTTGSVYIGGTNANSIVLGRPTADFYLQGASGSTGSTITASNGGFTTTVYFQDPTADVNYRFNPATAGTYDICTSAANCSLQTAYNASSSTEITLDSTRGGLTVRDKATPGANLLELQSNDGLATYLSLASTALTVNTTATGGTGNVITSNLSVTAGLATGNRLNVALTPASNSDADVIGTSNSITTSNGVSFSGDLLATIGQVNWSGTGASTGRLVGSTGKVVSAVGSGAIQNAYGVMAEAQFEGGSVTNYYGLHSTMNSANSVAIQNAYGLKIDNFAAIGSAAPTNFFAIATDGGMTRLTGNSAYQFQVQNSALTPVLNVDTTTVNLISNPSIEFDTTNWSAKGGAAISKSAAITPYDASFALRINTTAAIGDGAKFSYNFAAGTYTLSFFVKAAAGNSFAAIEAGRSDNGSTDTACILSPDPSGFSAGVNDLHWKRYTCTFATGAVSGSRYIYIKQTDATARTFYIDAVQLETGASATIYRPGKTAIGGSLIVNGGQPEADATETTLKVNTLAGGHGLIIRASGANDILKSLLDVRTADNTDSYFNVNEATRGTSVRGGNSLFNAAALDVTSIQDAAVALKVSAASGQTADIIQVYDGAGTPNKLFSIGATGAATFQNAANSATAFSVRTQGSLSVLNVDTTTRTVTVNGPMIAPSASSYTRATNTAGWVELGRRFRGTTNASTPDRVEVEITGGDYWGDGTTVYDIEFRNGVAVKRRDFNGGADAALHTLKIYAENAVVDAAETKHVIGFSLGSGAAFHSFNIRARELGDGEWVDIDTGTEPSTGFTNVTPTISYGAFGSGVATFQNASDSADAFRILNSTGSGSLQLFRVDTSSSRVFIGHSSADTTAALLVLDTKNNAGDPTAPTAVNGSMYYNSSTGKFRCYENSTWLNCLSGLNDAVTVENEQSGSVSNSGSATNTAYAAPSQINSATFIAPPSGKVMITWAGESQGNTASTWVRLSPEVRTGGVIGSGTIVLATSDEYSTVQWATTTSRSAGVKLLTGLTPGSTYNIRILWKTNTTTGNFMNKQSLQITPTW